MARDAEQGRRDAATPAKSAGKRLLWLLVIWTASVAAVAAVAGLLRALMRAAT
jgi:type III secretory pathway component EscS